MEAKKWTKEPWAAEWLTRSEPGAERGWHIFSVAEEDGVIADIPDDKDERKANAVRIVSCVNALAGLNPEKVAGLLEQARIAVARLGELDSFSAQLDLKNDLSKALSDLEGGGEYDPFEYIRNYYGVPAKVGARVTYRGKPGVVTGADDSRVKIQLEGDTFSRPYHPKDENLIWMEGGAK